MPVVEFAWFSASDSLKADYSLINPALDHIKKAEGCINVYYGYAEEDKDVVCLVIVWESYEHHKALTDDPSYSSVGDKLIRPIIGAIAPTIYHVEFTTDFYPAFGSPITEVLSGKAKEGKSQEEFKAALKVVSDLIVSAPYASGEAREEPGKYFVLIGWESAEAYSDVPSNEKFAQPLQNLREIGDLKLIHVKFTKYA